MERKNSTKQFVERNVREFKKFMGITTFPEYKIIENHIPLNESDQENIESLAAYRYNSHSGEHEIFISDDVLMFHFEPTIYHELTHMLDDWTYCKEDLTKYSENYGYTEYHASQVETMKIIGANSVKENINFSMNKEIKDLRKPETIGEYMIAPYCKAREMLNQSEFPESIEGLSVLLGLLFNFWGRRSICLMYASDYDAKSIEPDITAFRNFFSVNGIDPIKEWNDSLVGWLSTQEIEKLDLRFAKVLLYFIKNYNL